MVQFVYFVIRKFYVEGTGLLIPCDIGDNKFKKMCHFTLKRRVYHSELQRLF